MDFAKVIEGIAKNTPRDGETYLDPADGLLHCERCGGKREKKIKLGDREMVVPVICKCMSEQLETEERQIRAREQVQAVRRYRSMGFPDKEMQTCTFETDDGKNARLSAAMRAYVQNFDTFRKDGKGLLLYGDMGTGKSFYAACIVNALIDQGRPCLMTNFSRLTNTIGATWDKQEYIDSLTRFSLIAIDDLGVERDTAYMNEAVTTIIDSLYRAKVPLIITSNYEPKQLLNEGEIRRGRVYDRLLERCHPVKVDGESRRKERGRNEYREMNSLLGL